MKKKLTPIKPIECNIYVADFEHDYKSCKIEQTIISKHQHKKDMDKALNYEYDKDSVLMYKEQYENLFAPLFKEISRLNAEVRNLNKIIESINNG